MFGKRCHKVFDNGVIGIGHKEYKDSHLVTRVHGCLQSKPGRI